MVPARILAVDDDPKILNLMRRGLAFAGYGVDLAPDGEQALAIARERPPDLVVLDVMLPGLDGLEVCRRLRAGEPNLPILLLTAKDRVPDRVAGLDAGADDYLIKPFAFDELLARIRALLRRARPLEGDMFSFADLTLDPRTREVTRGTRPVELTTKEFDLLTFLAENPNHVFSKDELFRRIWNMDSVGDIATVTVHIKKIREKIEFDTSHPQYIETIWGVGYRFKI